jgi:hypothetical protein
MKHLHKLWHFDVRLESTQDGHVTASYVCDDESVRKVAAGAKA